ncbi:MAG: Phosphoenolpyruvate-protein phosphotransferase, partial [Verrucomicrobiaceae bacterium]|nr:Phosphoenolpyruvate-protein phosphotransferase [Verrucomicrobiaceae bacterium]
MPQILDTTSERLWRGLPVSTGVVEAVVHVLKDEFDEPAERSIEQEQVETELARLDVAIAATKREILALQKSIT